MAATRAASSHGHIDQGSGTDLPGSVDTVGREVTGGGADSTGAEPACGGIAAVAGEVIAEGSVARGALDLGWRVAGRRATVLAEAWLSVVSGCGAGAVLTGAVPGGGAACRVTVPFRLKSRNWGPVMATADELLFAVAAS
jgi:hypothetical protein